ncbi:MAG: CARDB domain-containing protein [Bacteroidota bacterium]
MSWAGNTTQTVTWDVANTDAAPVNCSNVDIYLSVDGGFTYPFLLLSGTPNDGSANVFIPDNQTNSARIKVKGNGNIFFDISNTNFTISPAIGQNDNDAGVLGIAQPQGDYCGDQIDPEFTIFNQGALNLTSLDIAYDVDGATPTVINWTGNLAPGGSEVITVPTLVIAGGSHTFNVNLSNPNGVADDNPTNNSSSSSFTTVTGAQAVTFSLQTDCWGEETSWSLVDDQGTVLGSATAGTYAAQDQTLLTVTHQ